MIADFIHVFKVNYSTSPRQKGAKIKNVENFFSAFSGSRDRDGGASAPDPVYTGEKRVHGGAAPPFFDFILLLISV